MRVQRIKIVKWRHFDGIELTIPDDAPLICIIGANGTGKSQILELIGACAQRIGLSPSSESNRGDPFGESGIFSIRFVIAKDTVPALEVETAYPEHHQQAAKDWDRTLTVASGDKPNGITYTVFAGGVNVEIREQFASAVIGIIQNSKSIHYLALDADRAYPKIQIQSHELGAAFERDWENTLKQSSFRITRNLYDEWFRYLMGIENKNNNEYIQYIRIARELGAPEPYFVDKLATYKKSLRKVLSHLIFVGIDSQKREVRFDSTGLSLSFDQLSGGEREIAFLVGQIERFSLKKGLLLVDEPELHLNYDLLRNWIGYLKSSVEEGQIWLATHSLEVVEVAGKDATFILRRDELTRRVKNADSLATQPILSTLSRAIGSPAFSISDLVFVFIEGEEEIGERERFRRICQTPPHVRFIEAGSCNEVVRRIDSLKDVAVSSGHELRVGGVVDGDWRTDVERESIKSQGLFALAVHEVENFFLHPGTLAEWMNVCGQSAVSVSDLILVASDQRAGSWIFDAARAQKIFRELPEPPKATRTLVHQLDWSAFDNPESRCDEILESYGGLDEAQKGKLKTHLIAKAKTYLRYRGSNDLWRFYEGKEVFRSLLKQIGFADENFGEIAITNIWLRKPELLPVELSELREYVSNI